MIFDNQRNMCAFSCSRLYQLKSVNPFQANILFFILLKMSESLLYLKVLIGNKKKTLG